MYQIRLKLLDKGLAQQLSQGLPYQIGGVVSAGRCRQVTLHTLEHSVANPDMRGCGMGRSKKAPSSRHQTHRERRIVPCQKHLYLTTTTPPSARADHRHRTRSATAQFQVPDWRPPIPQSLNAYSDQYRASGCRSVSSEHPDQSHYG